MCEKQSWSILILMSQKCVNCFCLVTKKEWNWWKHIRTLVKVTCAYVNTVYWLDNCRLHTNTVYWLDNCTQILCTDWTIVYKYCVLIGQLYTNTVYWLDTCRLYTNTVYWLDDCIQILCTDWTLVDYIQILCTDWTIVYKYCVLIGHL